LKIQGVLRHGKGLKGIKETRRKKFKKKAKAAKPDYPTLDIGVSDFPEQIESE
jgi:hypothetical protein